MQNSGTRLLTDADDPRNSILKNSQMYYNFTYLTFFLVRLVKLVAFQSDFLMYYIKHN